MRDGSLLVLERRAQPEISELESGQSCGKPGGSDLRAQALRYCSPQERVSSSPPVPHPPRLAGKIKGRKEELLRGSGAASCNRFLALGQKTAGRTCWRKRCTVEARMEGGPLPSTVPLPDLQAWGYRRKEKEDTVPKVPTMCIC